MQTEQKVAVRVLQASNNIQKLTVGFITIRDRDSWWFNPFELVCALIWITIWWVMVLQVLWNIDTDIDLPPVIHRILPKYPHDGQSPHFNSVWCCAPLRDLGLKTGIWASRLGYGPWGWDLGLEGRAGHGYRWLSYALTTIDLLMPCNLIQFLYYTLLHCYSCWQSQSYQLNQF